MNCQICGHLIRRQINCGLSQLQCEDRNQHFHYHCTDGCFCTYGGCMPENEAAK